MKKNNLFICFAFIAFTTNIFAQDQKILVFDPAGISTSFQYTLSRLTEDSVFVADSLDDSIFNYDALFLFLKYPYILSQTDANRLIAYTSIPQPIYIYSENAADSNSIAFLNYIGIEEIVWFLTSTYVDSVGGIDSVFTKDIVIDTSFMNWAGVPMIVGEMAPILHTWSIYLEFDPTYVSVVSNLQVVFDLYNLIDNEGFLRRVLQYFGLIPPPMSTQIEFFPATDTAWIYGGCVGPEIFAYQLSSTPVKDSIVIEPGESSVFYYYDLSGNLIQIEKYYFTVIDMFDKYEYELWLHPKLWPPFDPVLIPFDSVFHFYQSSFDIQLIVKYDGSPIDSLSQFFRADWGLSVDGEEQIPVHFSLSQNYPNPFNPSTVISYKLPVTSNVTLKVYDILGNEIATLVNEEKQPGTYEIEFNVAQTISLSSGVSARGGFSSGVYLYQLRAGNFFQTKKMILLK